MTRKGLISWGGWEGHHPERWVPVAKEWLKEEGFEVVTSNDLAFFTEHDLHEFALIVPIWTMGHMTPEQEEALTGAVHDGVGIGGWHGMCAAFNDNLRYKWMMGGQMVAHPGDLTASYDVRLVDTTHPITTGLSDFRMNRTEQYYMHVDSGNHVLATTDFGDSAGMPVTWIRNWGAGKVFYCSLGHSIEDLDQPGAMAMIRRGLRWAARG